MAAERWLPIAAAVLWAASLALPAVRVTGGPSLSGYDILVQGMDGWREGVVAWYANPVLGISLIVGWLGRYRWALAAALLGAALAVSSLWAESAAVSAGRSVPPFSFGIGFYVWLAAFGAALAAGAIGTVRRIG